MTADNKQQTAADGRTLVIAAAGTGGHVMPGLAVARVMADRGWKIVWIGTTTGMEKGLVERQGIEFHPLNFQGMRGRGITGMITGGIKMLKAIWDARKLLKKLRPTAVFSTGGYIAVPVCFAAQNLKRPIVLMNCDADLLMSTNTVLPFCDALACGFAGGARTFAGIKGHTTGNPVRAEIAALPAPAERFAGRTGPLKLFIFGGSLGAQVLNDVLPQALAMIPESERPIVLHQTGRDRDAAVPRQALRLKSCLSLTIWQRATAKVTWCCADRVQRAVRNCAQRAPLQCWCLLLPKPLSTSSAMPNILRIGGRPGW